MTEEATSPAPAAARTGRLLGHLERFGGMLVAPRATVARLLAGDEGRIGSILFWMVFLYVALAPERVGRGLLVARVDLWGGIQLLLGGFGQRLVVPLVGVLAATAVLDFAARRGGRELSIDRALDVAAHLLVPFLFISALSALFAGLGADAWFLPHHPLRGSTLTVTTRALLGFAPSLVLLALTVRALAARPGRAPENERPG